jgi:hypothetical protein
LTRAWAWEHARGMSKPLGLLERRCGVRGGARGGGGGSAQRSSPTCGAPAATEGYGLRNCMQKVRGKRVGAHRALNWTGKWRSGVGGEVRRRGVDRRRFSTRIHGRSGAEGGEERLGDDPGLTAMLLRDLAGTPVRRSGVVAVARGSAPLGARRAAAARFRDGICWVG